MSRKSYENLCYARQEFDPENDSGVPVCRAAYRKWYSWIPWTRFMMKMKGTARHVGAPEIYGYKRVSSYKCEIDQEEAQRAFMVITLKKEGLTETQIVRGMSIRYGATEDWWKEKMKYILNGYKYYCGRHLVYNADDEVVYPPFMEP